METDYYVEVFRHFAKDEPLQLEQCITKSRAERKARQAEDEAAKREGRRPKRKLKGKGDVV